MQMPDRFAEAVGDFAARIWWPATLFAVTGAVVSLLFVPWLWGWDEYCADVVWCAAGGVAVGLVGMLVHRPWRSW